jgi:osmotically-inducible protein OsmY
VVKEIKKGLEANWTTKWVSNDIAVSVNDGVATLTGKVKTWAQRSEAADVAYTTSGVWEVKKKLAVEGYDYDWDMHDHYAYP